MTLGPAHGVGQVCWRDGETTLGKESEEDKKNERNHWG